jgi:hypothetical protein
MARWRHALVDEETLQSSVSEWRHAAVEEVRGFASSAPSEHRFYAGTLLVRADVLARVEARADAAARSRASAHLASLDALAREYDRALVALGAQVARLRLELAESPDATADADAAACKVIAALEVRLAAYDDDCALLWHISASLKGGSARAAECQALLTAIRLSPFLSAAPPRAAKAFLAGLPRDNERSTSASDSSELRLATGRTDSQR